MLLVNICRSLADDVRRSLIILTLGNVTGSLEAQYINYIMNTKQINFTENISLVLYISTDHLSNFPNTIQYIMLYYSLYSISSQLLKSQGQDAKTGTRRLLVCNR